MKKLILFFVFILFSSLAYGKDIRQVAKEIQEEMSNQLPQKLSKNLLLRTVMSYNETLTFNAMLLYNKNYLQTRLLQSGRTMDSIKDQMKQMAKNIVCSSPILLSFINLGGKLQYNYVFQNGEHYLLTKIDNC